MYLPLRSSTHVILMLSFCCACSGKDNDSASGDSDADTDADADTDTDSDTDADTDTDTDTDPVGQLGTAINGEAGADYFGFAVALSGDGSRVVIGTRSNDGNGADSGQARVYEWAGGKWVQLGVDLDGEAAEDTFGYAVDISSDGSRIAVGSRDNDGDPKLGFNHAGHVRVFDYAGGAWTQVGADIDGVATGDQHGATLGLSADGTRLVVGAPSANSDDGTAYVYDLIGSTWTPVGDVLSGDHEFGGAVDISDDGTRIAVSSKDPIGDGFPGKVAVYELSGTTWTQVGGDMLGEADIDTFGQAVSLSADGTTIAIGAPDNDGGGNDSGHVRVFGYSSGAWTQIGADLDGVEEVDFGWSVSLSNDGASLVAGGPGAGGIARLYTLSADTWTEQTKPGFGTGDETGTAVAISGDGGTVAVSAALTDETGNNSGQVRVYAVE
jgi:hypothetical protein